MSNIRKSKRLAENQKLQVIIIDEYEMKKKPKEEKEEIKPWSLCVFCNIHGHRWVSGSCLTFKELVPELIPDLIKRKFSFQLLEESKEKCFKKGYDQIKITEIAKKLHSVEHSNNSIKKCQITKELMDLFENNKFASIRIMDDQDIMMLIGKKETKYHLKLYPDLDDFSSESKRSRSSILIQEFSNLFPNLWNIEADNGTEIPLKKEKIYEMINKVISLVISSPIRIAYAPSAFKEINRIEIINGIFTLFD